MHIVELEPSRQRQTTPSFECLADAFQVLSCSPLPRQAAIGTLPLAPAAGFLDESYPLGGGRPSSFAVRRC
jgi:hypothetical protein